MRKLALVVLTLVGPCLAQAATPTADELLAAMDEVLQFDTRTSTATMQVIDARRTRSYRMKTYARGQDDAAILYLEPAREKGTKMLKKEDNLWLYMPRAERVQKISGHMLRQGMMGSDMSYEDMLEAADFEERYEAEVIGEEETDGRQCWKLEARARDESVSYPRRLIWIDKQNMMPLRQELFALSGMMLKVWIMSDIEMISGRPVATHMEISDQLKQDSRTVFLLEEVSFDVELESEVFTRRWLERH
ncbi:MAG: outer membrane lipoprotein-sorting protein [Acidobacteriota bacterium]|jgi:outer membrane lipoprotein-sorting protein